MIDSIRDPTSATSLKTISKFLEGGTTEEQINILERFGVSKDVTSVLQVLTLSDNPEYAANVAKTPKKIIQGFDSSSNETTLQSLLRIQQENTEYLLRNTDMIDAGVAFGLSPNQTLGVISIASKNGLN